MEVLGGPADRASWSNCAGAASDETSKHTAPAAPASTSMAERSLGLALRAVLAGKRAAAKHYNAAEPSSSCHIAAASVIVSLELVRLRKALTRHAHAVRAHQHSMMAMNKTLCNTAQTLDDLFEELRAMNHELQQHAAERKLLYGILGKEGHRRRSARLRMFLLEGTDVSYYKLDGGTLKLKGSFPLAQIVSVVRAGPPEKCGGWATVKAAARYMGTLGVNDRSSHASAADILYRDHTLQVDLKAPSKLYPGRKWHPSYKLFAPDTASQDAWVGALRPIMQGTLMRCESIWLNCPTQWELVHVVLHRSQISIWRCDSKIKASLDRLHELKLMKAELEATLDADSAEYLALGRKIRSEMRELSALERESQAISAGSLSIRLTEVVGISKQHVNIPESVAEDRVGRQFEMISLMLKNGTLHLQASPCGDGEEAGEPHLQLERWFTAMQGLL